MSQQQFDVRFNGIQEVAKKFFNNLGIPFEVNSPSNRGDYSISLDQYYIVQKRRAFSLSVLAPIVSFDYPTYYETYAPLDKALVPKVTALGDEGPPQDLRFTIIKEPLLFYEGTRKPASEVLAKIRSQVSVEIGGEKRFLSPLFGIVDAENVPVLCDSVRQALIEVDRRNSEGKTLVLTDIGLGWGFSASLILSEAIQNALNFLGRNEVPPKVEIRLVDPCADEFTDGESSQSRLDLISEASNIYNPLGELPVGTLLLNELGKEEVKALLEECNIEIVPLPLSSSEYFRRLEGETDFLHAFFHVDGEHKFSISGSGLLVPQVLCDVSGALSQIAPGGRVLIDDFKEKPGLGTYPVSVSLAAFLKASLSQDCLWLTLDWSTVEEQLNKDSNFIDSKELPSNFLFSCPNAQDFKALRYPDTSCLVIYRDQR
jgi:hypothetical protein